MPRILKFFLVAIGLLLLGVGVAAAVLLSQADRFARQGIERTLEQTLLSEVTLERSHLALLQGRLDVEGLTVSNPEPFKNAPALRLERVTVEFDLKTLLSDTPTIRDIALEGAGIDLIYRLGEGTNLGALARNASQYGERLAAAPSDKAQRRFIIQRFHGAGAKITVSTNVLPGAAATLNVAPFTLNHLGEDRAITPAEVTAIFLRSLITEVVTVKGTLKPLADLLTNELDSLTHTTP